jgi:hypothetical protein
MKNYKTHKQCNKFCKNNLGNKIVFNGIPEYIFKILAEMYGNVNFHEVAVSKTNKRNNKLIFGEDNIIFLNYSHKFFQSKELNPCFHRDKVNLTIKMSEINIHHKVYKYLIKLKLTVRIGERNNIGVRYKILINTTNYRYIEKIVRAYEMSEQVKS